MIVKITDAVNKVLRLIITIVLVFLVCLLFVQIISRTFFNTGIPWIEELSKMLFVSSMFLGICVGVKESSHIKIDVITNLIESRGRTASLIINTISWIGELVFFVYLGIYGYKYALSGMNAYTTMLNIRQGYIYMAIPISCIISIIFVISNIWQKVVLEKEGKK
jgi:TRAP-type C4-dicarboxylate transport system permease small subunit